MVSIASTLGGIVLLCYAILKHISPSITDIGSGAGGLVEIVAWWFILNLALIVMEIYIEFPYQVQGYYKRKYAEEYRKWEGKSQIEWYGERYFNKHILGTSKEDKTGNSDLANAQMINSEKVHKAVLSDQKKENGGKNDE